jgi:anti-sigma factor RsiW
MDCAEVRNRLPEYAEQCLDGRTRRAVEGHLGGCGECRSELEAQEAAVALVGRYGALNPPPGLFNAVRNQIESGAVARERAPWWSFLLTAPGRAGAMGLALSALALGLWLPTGAPGPTPTLPMVSGAGQGEVASELVSSIRQHAQAAGQGTLTDRVAWEAMAQLVAQEPKEAAAPRRAE